MWLRLDSQRRPNFSLHGLVQVSYTANPAFTRVSFHIGEAWNWSQTSSSVILKVGHMTPQGVIPSFWGATKTSVHEWNVLNLKLNQRFPYCLHAPQHRSFFFFFSVFKPKRGTRMRQKLLKSNKHDFGTYLCCCKTIRLLGINRIYTLELNLKVIFFFS